MGEGIGGIKNDTEEILAIVQQIMVQMGLSAQIKPRDELTRYSSDSLKLIKQAQQLLKRIPTTAPQYAQLAISLGSVVSSQGDLQQAEQLEVTTLITQLSALHVDIIKKRRIWWDQLDDEWKKVFKQAISINSEPSDGELGKIINLQELNFNND